MGREVDRREGGAGASVEVRSRLGSAGTPVTVIDAFGEHDYAARGVLASTLEKCHGHVIVDLARCTFLDTAVIGALIGKALELGKQGDRLELIVPRSAPFARKIDQLHFGTVLPVLNSMPFLQSVRPV
jgi:hypothetical protein